MKSSIIAAVLAASSIGLALHAQGKEHPIPRLVENDGRYALFVDGAPFLMLGAQSNNSSDWPATLPKVWPAIEYLHANTLETPIYWEQFEPKPGQFDYSQVDYDPRPGPRASRPSGPALVRHLEERQPALHAGMDEARAQRYSHVTNKSGESVRLSPLRSLWHLSKRTSARSLPSCST
jgi:hypothetical protein